MTEQLDPNIETVAADTPAAEGGAAAADHGPDLDSLLDQFDRETANGSPVAAQADDAESEAGAQYDAEIASTLSKFGAEGLTQAEQRIADLEANQQRLAELEMQRWKERAQAEQDRIVSELRTEYADRHLPESYFRAWLDSFAVRNEQFAHAFIGRENGPSAEWAYKNVLKHALRDLHREIERIPDTDLSEDRAMIAAAMRGPWSKAQEEAPPNLGRMSNAEFRQHVREKHGFDSGV